MEYTTEQKEENKRYQHVPTNYKHQLMSRFGCLHLSTQTAMSLVLRHIGMNGGITRYGGKDRQWMFVCCDGRRHSLYQRILYEVVICDHCNEPCLNIQSYKQHHKENHKKMYPIMLKEI